MYTLHTSFFFQIFPSSLHPPYEMPPQNAGNKETLSFRCPAQAKEDFIRNVESRGWTKDEALRRLVESCNELFAKTGGKPEWPLVVIDDDAVAIIMDPKAKAELRRKHQASAMSQLGSTEAGFGAFVQRGKENLENDPKPSAPSGIPPKSPRRPR